MSGKIEVLVAYFDTKQKGVIDKKFTISITPNRFNADYPEYLTDLDRVLEVTAEYKQADTTEKRAAALACLESLNLRKTLAKKYDLVRTMLTANGYEFDEEFWDLYVDPLEVDKFIYACAMKDVDSENSSKKKEIKL